MRQDEFALLNALRFRNSAVVRRDMRFEYRQRPCYYAEDVDAWSTAWNDGWYSYLYEIRRGKPVDPPSGMRSAVPLGGLGAGTVELRADGSLRDWTIFNNSPAGGGQKVQLDDSFFACAVRAGDSPSRVWTLRTHPPRHLPAIEQIEYSGAYPVSRLRFKDAELPLELTLHACSEFRIRDAYGSATPAAVFHFALENRSSRTVDAALMFQLPNPVGGTFSSQDGLLLVRSAEEPLATSSGSMCVRMRGHDGTAAAWTADDMFCILEQFGAGLKNMNVGAAGGYGALAGDIRLEPGQVRLVTVVLAWYFPNRPHGADVPGNFYATRFRDASDAADSVLARTVETLKAIHEWQRVCFDNTLPEWLQDAMINSAGTIAKTGMWFADGRWRQWESFSCPAVDPIHIHFYRDLPYAWFFRPLRLSELRGYARAQAHDGYIQENLGFAGGKLDAPSGRNMGDGCTAFILEVWQDWLWTADRAVLDELWPTVHKAARWQIRRAEAFGLPDRLDNSYDWWSFADKDLCSYNAFLHLAALLAAEKLAQVQRDFGLAQECRRCIETGRDALSKKLWTGERFRSWWMKDGNFPDALHADALYGELWARILGLEPTADEAALRAHLATERTKNDSPFGLLVMQGTECDDDRYPEVKRQHSPGAEGPVNRIVWEAGSLDWCALNIWLGGDVTGSLALAAAVINKWREKLNDQWDIRDLSTGWDGYPWCNSHYARHLMLWAIPLALSGQQYSAFDKELTFAPKVKAPATLPFFTPTACGNLELRAGKPARLTVLSGRLELDRVQVAGVSAGGPIVLNGGGCMELC